MMMIGAPGDKGDRVRLGAYGGQYWDWTAGDFCPPEAGRGPLRVTPGLKFFVAASFPGKLTLP